MKSNLSLIDASLYVEKSYRIGRVGQCLLHHNFGNATKISQHSVLSMKIRILIVLCPFYVNSRSSICILVPFLEILFIKNVLVPFIENFYGGSVIGRFSKLTIKPGFCTKPEFGTNGSKRNLTGGQYYKIGALQLFWSKWPISRRNIFNELSILMKVTISLLTNLNFDEWENEHYNLSKKKTSDFK